MTNRKEPKLKIDLVSTSCFNIASFDHKKLHVACVCHLFTVRNLTSTSVVTAKKMTTVLKVAKLKLFRTLVPCCHI